MNNSEYVVPGTFEEQLDAVLVLLLNQKLNSSFADHANSGYDVASICEVLKLNIDKAQQTYLVTILSNDGYVEPLHAGLTHLIRISDSGVQFITSGGYVQEIKDDEHRKEIESLEIKLKKSTLNTNNWTKVGIAISIVFATASLVISIIALVKD